MTAKVGNRRKARELALKALYMFEAQGGEPDEEVEELFWEEQPVSEPVRKRARLIASGVRDNLAELDRTIEAASEHWRLDRMSRVDRNILRLAVFEMLRTPEDVPHEVAIDEAVEIARRYGDNKSPAFINGVLDKIWKGAKPDEA